MYDKLLVDQCFTLCNNVNMKSAVAKFDESGNLYISRSIKFGGEMSPRLRPREWWYWLLNNTENVPGDALGRLVGSRTTIWRAKKGLIQKGYL